MVNEDDFRKLINAGCDITGSIAGAFVGAAVAGPAGLLIGASLPTIISESFKTISSDVLSRQISKREEQKIGAGYIFAIQRIEKNLEEGKTIRNDGFMDDDKVLSDANTILEGVTIKIQKEWELKKLQFYGNFLGNISFRKDIDFNYASVLLRLIESMSYRELCLIAVFQRKGTPEIDLTPIESKFKMNYMMHNFNYSMYSDLVELDRISVFRRVPPFKLGDPIGNCVLSDVGEKLYYLMNLQEIDEIDFLKAKADLENMLGKTL